MTFLKPLKMWFPSSEAGHILHSENQKTELSILPFGMETPCFGGSLLISLFPKRGCIVYENDMRTTVHFYVLTP